MSWGLNANGFEVLGGAVAIQATCGAFAAIKDDGSVVTWGDNYVGGDSSAVQMQMKNVLHIQAGQLFSLPHWLMDRLLTGLAELTDTQHTQHTPLEGRLLHIRSAFACEVKTSCYVWLPRDSPHLYPPPLRIQPNPPL